MSWDALTLDFGTAFSMTVGVLIGSLGAYLTFKYRQVGQVQLLFVRRIRIFDALVKNLPHLDVFYNSKNVSEHLIYVEGAIVNTGTIDITKAMIPEHAIVITVGEGNNLVEFQIKAGPLNGILSPKDGRSIELPLDLLKRNESIAFSALVEQVNPESPLFEIENRIAQVNVLRPLHAGYIMSGFARFLISALVVAASLVLFLLVPSDPNPYEYIDDNGNAIGVNIVPKTDGTVDIVHTIIRSGPDDSLVVSNLSENEIFKTDRLKIATSTSIDTWPMYVIAILVCLAIVYFLFEYIRGRRLRRLTSRIVRTYFPDANL